MKTVEDLPEELLIEIFKLLDVESLKNVALTNQNWKQIAEQSIPWAAKLSHSNTAEADESWADSILASKRKFRQIKLTSLHDDTWSKKVIEIFATHGQNIRKLFLFEIYSASLSILSKVLQSTPNLESIVISEVHSVHDLVTEENADEAKLPELSRLKNMEINQSEMSILSLFKKAKLTTLKMLSGFHSLEANFLIDFLSTQTDLETLALRSLDHSEQHLFSSALKDKALPSKLKKLSLLGLNLLPEEYNNLLQLMKINWKLEELEIGRKLPDFVFEFIFKSLKRLKTLRLMTNAIPSNIEFYNGLVDNTSVRELILMDSPENLEELLIEFMRHLPNLQKLTLKEDCERDVLEFVAANMNSLKHLSIQNGNEDMLDGLEFRCLTSLHIKYLDEEVDWSSFTRANPGVVDLKILVVYFPAYANFKVITRNWKLETLTLDNGTDANQSFFKTIRENCKDLKLLKITKDSLGVDVSSVADIKALRLTNDAELNDNEDLSSFWREADYGKLPSLEHNWTDENPDEDEFNPDEMDPFEIEDMLFEMGIVGSDDDYDDDYDYYDDDDIDDS